MNFKKPFENELFRASFILLILMNVANVLNYVFHFVMGRMLGPSDYGVLAVLASIIYIFSVPTASIQTLVAKYATNFNVKGENGKIKGMLKIMIIEALILATILFILFCFCAFFLANYIKISFWLLCLTGIFLFAAFLSPIGIGILQGLKKFSVLGWNTVLNSVIKIIIAVVLVLLGFGIYGPILGFILGTFISFLFIFPFIKEIINSEEISERKAIISRSSLSTLISIFIITLMYSLDIIFAKILFSADLAGKYAVASMIGKMIFFGTASVSSAMFPISTERFLKTDKEKTKGIITKTFFIVSVLCLIAIAFLGIFPKFIVGLLFGSKYLEISNIMLYMGVTFSMISLTNTWILYKLSVEEFRIRHAGILIIFLILQIAALIIFGQNLYSFALTFMFSTIITFVGSILLIRKWKK